MNLLSFLRYFRFTIVLTVLFPLSLEAANIIRSDSRAYLNLEGEWAVQPVDDLTLHSPPSGGEWGKEYVPNSRSEALRKDSTPYAPNLSTFLNKEGTAMLDTKGSAAWFKRVFEAPTLSPEETRQTRIYLEGVAFKSEVWLNGYRLGGSLLGQVPTSYDVSEILRPGENELIIGVAGRAALIDVANQTYLAAAAGVGAGIWGKVELQWLPTLAIEQVFIDTSVKDKQISLDIVVKNSGSEQQVFRPEVVILDGLHTEQLQFSGEEISIAPGETRRFTLSQKWPNPQLWTPTSPTLYFAKVRLNDGDSLIDSQTERFGFREFKVHGRDFYLNGVRTTLLRNSNLRSLGTGRDTMFAELRAQAGRPYNTIRAHLGFNARALLELCDELGYMVVPESAWHNAIESKFSLANRDVWLPNVEAYTRALIELHYNNPSVVMWNLSNESLWGRTDASRMDIADRIVAAARSVDRIRPLDADAGVGWGGRLSALNIHYPENSVSNTLREKYPNSAFVFPNDAYWLSQDRENISWRARFMWDRPLIIGEYWYPSGDADPKSAFMGESVFDWERWRHQRMDARGEDGSEDNEWVRSQKLLADAYRIQGVAGIDPWASDGQKVMPTVTVRPIDFFPNFFGGTKGTRTYVVFNDSGLRYNTMNLQCRLVADGVTLWEKTIPATVSPGEHKQFKIDIEPPAVSAQVAATLSVRLRYERNNHWMELGRTEETVFILPRASLAEIDSSTILLLDTTPDGTTAKALAKLGLHLSAKSHLGDADLNAATVLIIGEDTDTGTDSDRIVKFVNKGGRVIILRQHQWHPLTGDLPDIDPDHVTTRSWRRTYDHPITVDLDDRQFSYWRPDHLVALKTFRKPAAGNARILLDSGGLYGLRWSPLLEVPVGNGVFLLTSLDLARRVEEEPLAGRMLENLVQHAQAWKPSIVSPLRLLTGDNLPLRSALAAAGVVAEDGVKGSGPILLDASYAPTPEELETIRTYVIQGGRLWLHGFSSSTIDKISSLLPFRPVFAPYDASVQSAARRSDDPVLNNLSSFDFFWTKINLEARRDYFERGHPTAKLGGEVLQLPTIQSGIRLIEPALLVKIPSGNGEILLDTLGWPLALGSETDKVTRIVSALAANQGAEVRLLKDDRVFDYFPLDLSRHANMGYYDRVAGDGKGGWTDQGDNDMRFFLINQLGKEGGLETGMETASEPFPERVTLAGTPFWPIDARTSDGRAVISLRGESNGAGLPSTAHGIPVDRKADSLWFLQAAGWVPPEPNQEIARYVIHYRDGTRETLPIRYGLEISEWWNPMPLPEAKVAWTGHNLRKSPIGIYSVEWRNPYPEKEIATIDVIGNLSRTQFVVLAISGGVTTNVSTPTAQLIGDWRLDMLSGGEVPSRVEGGGSLVVASDNPPDSIADEERSGLYFRDGRALRGQTLDLLGGEGFGPLGQPFAIRMVLTPEGKSPGFYAGLLQAATYQKNGFRLLLRQRDLRLHVEVFHSDNVQDVLTASTPLELGRTYIVELRFDGNYATLLIDGRIETMKEMPPPNPFAGTFQLGRASGTDYFFDGVIRELSIFKLLNNR